MQRPVSTKAFKSAPITTAVLCFLMVSVICLGFFLSKQSLVFAHLATPSAKSQMSSSINWPMFGFNSRNVRFNPDEHSIGPTNVSHLGLDWSDPIAVEYASPVVANGILYITSGTSLEALDASTGKLIWGKNLGGPSSPVPAIANGIVYIAASSSSHGQLFAYHAATGALAWSFTSNGYNSYTNPVVVNGVIYTTWDDGYLYAINASTGKLLWTFQANAEYCQPAVVGGILYLGTFEHMYALNAITGKKVWVQNFGSTDGFYSVSVANGFVYSVSYLQHLYAFNATNGTIAWNAATNIDSGYPLAVANGVIYGASASGGMYASNASNGAAMWKTPTGGEINASPAVANGVVYIGSYDKKMYAFNARNGKILWTYATSFGFIMSSPIVVNGTLYFGSDKLYAFHLPN